MRSASISVRGECSLSMPVGSRLGRPTRNLKPCTKPTIHRQRVHNNASRHRSLVIQGVASEPQTSSPANRDNAGSDGVPERAPEWVARHADNPALSGNFAPVQDERTHRQLTVEGTIPKHLNGAFLRNGPNPPYEPINTYHWFDGQGMIHYVRMNPEDNAASYGCRYVQTIGYKEEATAGKRLYMSIGETPVPQSILMGLKVKGQNWRRPDSPYWVIQQPNTANNGLTYHAGTLLATLESGSAYEVEVGPELRCQGPHDFRGSWTTADFWTENFTAHPKVCPETGELIYIGYNLVPAGGSPTVTVGVVGAEGAVEHRTVVEVARPSMQHDVAVTRTRTVLLDGPLVFNMDKSIAGGRPFDFHNSQPARFGVMPRRGSATDVVWIDADESCYSFHVMNAWDHPEDPNQVVVVVCRLDETTALGMADIFGEGEGWAKADAFPEPSSCLEAARLHRFVLDVEARRVVDSAPLSEPALRCDFPCVSPRVVGQPCSFGYTAGVHFGPDGTVDGITTFDAVIKHDLRGEGSAERRALGAGRFCGDILFVPEPEPEAEDHGHLLVMCHVVPEDRTELLVLDARDILADPVAVIHIPTRVPYGFHCEYIPGPLPQWEV